MARRQLPRVGGIPYVVERLGPQDRTAILEHLRALDDADRALRFGVATDDDAVARYVDGLAFDRDTVLAVRGVAGALLGVAHVAFGATGVELGLSVATGQRRHGVGRRLAAAALHEAERRGADEFRVHYAATNTAMHRIAEQLGLAVGSEGSDMLARRRLRVPPSAPACAPASADTDTLRA